MSRWSVRIDPKADKNLARLGGQDRTRVLKFLHNRLAGLSDPRQLGAALHGDFAGLWKYRVGDIRIVAKMRDGELLILVVQIGNRREVYR